MHNGLLFLDELPEFPRQALDALRQPIETGADSLARAEVHISYQASFQLVAAMNLCRCGYAEASDLACHRLPIYQQEYIGRLFGPLLDRFEVRVSVPPMQLSGMIGSEKGEASPAIPERVTEARVAQMGRQNCLNAHLDDEVLYKLAAPDSAGQNLLDRIADTKKVSARGFNRILRVACTLACLDHRDTPSAENIATAIRWRDTTF